MAEGIKSKNIFIDLIGKMNNQEKTERKAEIDKNEKNIFKTGVDKNPDTKRILDTSVNYTKEKYGSPSFLSELELMEDGTDYIETRESESKTDTKHVTSAPTVSEGAKKSSEVADKSVKRTGSPLMLKDIVCKHSTEKDENGNEVKIYTYTDKDGNFIREERSREKTVTSGNPYRETVYEETDRAGKVVYTVTTTENLKDGSKSVTKENNRGVTDFTQYDASGNRVYSKKTTVSSNSVMISETDRNGNKTDTKETHAASGVIINEKTVTAPSGKMIYYSKNTDDAKNNNHNSIVSLFDEQGRLTETSNRNTDNTGNVTSFEETKFTYTEHKIATSDPTETMTMEYKSSNERDYTYTETNHLVSGDKNVCWKYPDSLTVSNFSSDDKYTCGYEIIKTDKGSDKFVYDADLKIKSMTQFIEPPQVYGPIYGMTDTELTDPEDISASGGHKKSGDYINYKYDAAGNRTISSAYHIDEEGNKVDFTDAEIKSFEIGADGEIENSYQRQTGDCWALSGINSLSYSEKGREVLSEALEYNEEGAVVHTYFGDYKIDYEEIENAQIAIYTDEDGNYTGSKYSSGDTDVLVLELAIEKLRTDIKNGKYDVIRADFVDGFVGSGASVANEVDAEDPLSGGWNSEVIYYLTGNQSESAYYTESGKKDLLDKYSENKNSSLCFDINEEKKLTDINGNPVTLPGNHAYAVKSVTKNGVVIINPWNSSEEIELSKDDFLKYSSRIEYTDLNTIEKDTGLYTEKTESFPYYLFKNLCKE